METATPVFRERERIQPSTQENTASGESEIVPVRQDVLTSKDGLQANLLNPRLQEGVRAVHARLEVQRPERFGDRVHATADLTAAVSSVRVRREES